jgi:hypothetical protein
MAERHIKVQVVEFLEGGGKRVTNVELPERTGNEGFDFLGKFHERTGGGAPIDQARERRWREVMANRKKEQR